MQESSRGSRPLAQRERGQRFRGKKGKEKGKRGEQREEERRGKEKEKGIDLAWKRKGSCIGG